jgi:endoglucanase
MLFRLIFHSVPYVVGINPNSPQNPHSAPASGGNDVANIDTSPASEAHVIYGAVVGGPDKEDRYWDERSDWVQTEVALDYNAPMVYLAAWKVATDGNDPFYTRLQEGAYNANRPSGTRPCKDPNALCPTDDVFNFSKQEQTAVGVIMGLGAALILGMGSWLAWEWRKSLKKSL